MRRVLIAFVLIVPALVLIGWLVSAQLPRWTAPQANWFPPNTPGVCAIVASLKLYDAQPVNVGGISGDAAVNDAMQAVTAHYQVTLLNVTFRTDALFQVQATLPGEQRRGYYVIPFPLNADALRKVAIVYLDAQTGDVKALITAIDDPAANCEFDVKAALLAAVRTPPLILLVAYGALTVVGLGTWWLFKRRGNHR